MAITTIGGITYRQCDCDDPDCGAKGRWQAWHPDGELDLCDQHIKTYMRIVGAAFAGVEINDW